MNERESIRFTAEMEGNATVVANIGDKKRISEMELICLVNFAEIGLFSLFASIDGQIGEDAHRDLEQRVDAIRKTFAKGEADGLNRLSTSTAAMLRSERFRRYLVEVPA
jgi:hypothetical protein